MTSTSWLRIAGIKASTILLGSLILLLSLTGCEDKFGEKLKFNNCELYHTSRVTPAEAKKLGEYMKSSMCTGGSRQSYQLDKKKDKFIFRMVTKKGMRKAARTIFTSKLASIEISNAVFAHAPVEIHICDLNLKTAVTVNAPRLVVLSDVSVYYQPQVPKQDIQRLGVYLKKTQKTGADSNAGKSVFIDKKEGVYYFELITTLNIKKTKQTVAVMQKMGHELSKEVFGGAPVRMKLYDKSFKQIINTIVQK